MGPLHGGAAAWTGASGIETDLHTEKPLDCGHPVSRFSNRRVTASRNTACSVSAAAQVVMKLKQTASGAEV
jgi:hypothetical protein